MNFPVHLRRVVLRRRLIELFLPTVGFSVLITLLNVSGIVYKRYNVILTISAFVVIFAILNLIKLRRCYFDMHDKKAFYMLNFMAHGIFAVVNFILFLFLSNEIYAWFFSITKNLTFLNIDTIYSILLFHYIGFLSILIAPVGMKWIFEEDKEDEETI